MSARSFSAVMVAYFLIMTAAAVGPYAAYFFDRTSVPHRIIVPDPLGPTQGAGSIAWDEWPMKAETFLMINDFPWPKGNIDEMVPNASNGGSFRAAVVINDVALPECSRDSLIPLDLQPVCAPKLHCHDRVQITVDEIDGDPVPATVWLSFKHEGSAGACPQPKRT